MCHFFFALTVWERERGARGEVQPKKWGGWVHRVSYLNCGFARPDSPEERERVAGSVTIEQDLFVNHPRG